MADRKLDLRDYVQVDERIAQFYEKYPDGSIQTEMVHLEGEMVVFKAMAYRHPDDKLPVTGYAYEREGQGYVNKTSFVENAETSAIGRALANLNFQTNRDGKLQRPSREEMEKVKRMTEPAVQLASDEQRDKIRSLLLTREVAPSRVKKIGALLDDGATPHEAADQAIEWLRKQPEKEGV